MDNQTFFRRLDILLEGLGMIYIFWIGGWTLAENITFALNKGLYENIFIAIIIWSLLALIFIYLPREDQVEINITTDNGTKSQNQIIYIALFCITGFSAAYLTKNLFLYWVISSLTIIALFYIEFKSGGTFFVNDSLKPDKKNSIKQIWLLLLLIAGSVAFSYFANRPNPDDTYYLGMAARAAEAPYAPYSRDYPTFPPGTVENNYPLYEWMGYVQFIGLISWITSTQPLVTISYIVALVGSAYIVISYALLYRKVFKDYWLMTLFVTVAIFMIDGSHQFNSANFSFVRIWQGKAMLFHILRPLVLYFGYSFGKNRNDRDLFILVLANVGGIGLTPISIWLTPVLTAGGILTGVIFSRKYDLKTLLLGGLSLVYPFFVGAVSFQKVITTEYAVSQDLSWLDGLQRGIVDPANNYFWWQAGFILLFLFIAPNRLTRLLGLVTGAIFFLVFMNPLIAPFLAKYITTPDIYYRTLFLLLLVPSTAWIIAWVSIVLQRGLSKVTWLNFADLKKFLSLGVVIGLYTLIVPTTFMFSNENAGIWFGNPGVNAEKYKYDMVLVLYSKLENESVIVAPYDISWMLPTLKGGYWPIVFRQNELALIQLTSNNIFHDEIETSGYFQDYLGGVSNISFNEQVFSHVISKFSPSAFVAKKRINDFAQLDEYLSSKGYTRNENGLYFYWIKEN